jgi:hypothetical protein
MHRLAGAYSQLLPGQQQVSVSWRGWVSCRYSGLWPFVRRAACQAARLCPHNGHLYRAHTARSRGQGARWWAKPPRRSAGQLCHTAGPPPPAPAARVLAPPAQWQSWPALLAQGPINVGPLRSVEQRQPDAPDQVQGAIGQFVRGLLRRPLCWRLAWHWRVPAAPCLGPCGQQRRRMQGGPLAGQCLQVLWQQCNSLPGTEAGSEGGRGGGGAAAGRGGD